MKYKALMIDVDGTLAKSQERTTPTPRVIKAIAKAQDKIHIGLATGRPYFLIQDIANILSLSGPSIVNDGAQVIDLTTNETFYKQSILHDDIPSIVTLLRDNGVDFFINDDGIDVPHTSDYIPNDPFSIFTTGFDKDLAHSIREGLSSNPRLHVTSYISWINGLTGILVSHKNATKQHGILEVAKALDISTDEIIGIGDGYNDFPLLMACGLKVAMGNAVPELKEIADYIAPTVEEDGVADVIEKFILNPTPTP
jgi:HAD superfamily hydrolase (TIGR01484 family)